MKKIYSVLALAVGLSVSSQAQRLVDLQVTMSAPTTNATVTSGQSFNTTFVVKNVGSVSLKTTDTVLYGFAVDNSLLQFNNGGQTFTAFGRSGKALAQNDTMMFNISLTITFASTLNGTHNFCVVAVPSNHSADSVRDNITNNNQGCANVNFVGGTTGINDLSATLNESAVTNVYPNPATTQVAFDVHMDGNDNVSLRIFDLTGRVVYEENKGRFTRGNHSITVNTANYVPGLYFYQVQMGEKVSTGKFTVAK